MKINLKFKFKLFKNNKILPFKMNNNNDKFKNRALEIIKILKNYPLLNDLSLDMEIYLIKNYHCAIGRRIAYEYEINRKYIKETGLKNIITEYIDNYDIEYMQRSYHSSYIDEDEYNNNLNDLNDDNYNDNNYNNNDNDNNNIII